MRHRRRLVQGTRRVAAKRVARCRPNLLQESCGAKTRTTHTLNTHHTHTPHTRAPMRASQAKQRNGW